MVYLLNIECVHQIKLLDIFLVIQYKMYKFMQKIKKLYKHKFIHN